MKKLLILLILTLPAIFSCERERDPVWTPEAEALKPLLLTLKANPPRWDVNQDGIVDIFDLVLIGKHYGEKYEIKESPISDLLQESEEKYLQGDVEGAISSLKKAINLLEKKILPPPNVILLEDTVNVTEDIFGNFKLMGEMKNIGGRTAVFCEITVTLKDKEGKVIGTPSTFVKGSPIKLEFGETDTGLRPGETGSFELHSSVEWKEVADWSYKISWQEVD